MSVVHPSLLALGLALASLVWWLHRARSRGQTLHVPSLILFRAVRLPTPLDPRPARRADPAWIRRALLVAALCVALAGLRRDVASGTVVVWVDGAPSMLTVEGGVTRLDRALATLTRDLAAQGSVEVTVRSLARADFVVHLTSPFVLDSRRVPRGMPAPPEAASLSRSAEQWVVTDGASDTLAQWLATASVDHLIQVGAATENAAVVRVALRSSLTQPGHSDVLVALHNAGRLPAARRLEIRGGEVSLTPRELTLLPGETRNLRVAFDAAPTSFEARLLPSDGLPLDDSLTVDVPGPLALRISIDPSCGAALEAALGANMAVERTGPGEAQLLVDCSDRWRQSRLPRLRLRQAFETQPIGQSAYWNPAVVDHATPLPPGLRTTGQQLAVDAGETEVLSTGAHALVVLRTRPTRLVDSILDLRDGSLAARAEYPLLIATLLDVTAADDLLGRVVSNSRPLESVRIAPHTLPPARPPSRVVRDRSVDLTPTALVLALLALIWEVAAAARSLWQNRQYHLGQLR
jgi:hypothetical protein